MTKRHTNQLPKVPPVPAGLTGIDPVLRLRLLLEDTWGGRPVPGTFPALVVQALNHAQVEDASLRRLYAHSCYLCPLRGMDSDGRARCNWHNDIPLPEHTRPEPVSRMVFPESDLCPMHKQERVLVGRSIGLHR